MSSQTTRTSSPHHLLYRLEGKDDVLPVQEARGGGVCRCVNKVFTALPYCHVYSHVVSWRARATRSCKWPNSPNFPSVVVVVVVAVCPGQEESGAWPGLPGLPRLPLSHSLAGKWVMFSTASVRCTDHLHTRLYNECTSVCNILLRSSVLMTKYLNHRQKTDRKL